MGIWMVRKGRKVLQNDFEVFKVGRLFTGLYRVQHCVVVLFVVLGLVFEEARKEKNVVRKEEKLV